MIIHIGSNEIPNVDAKTLTEKTIKHIKTLTPAPKLFHSDILPKIDDSYMPGIHYINETVGMFSARYNIRVINHPQFCGE